MSKPETAENCEAFFTLALLVVGPLDWDNGCSQKVTDKFKEFRAEFFESSRYAGDVGGTWGDPLTSSVTVRDYSQWCKRIAKEVKK